jgi:hypothetical protein
MVVEASAMVIVGLSVDDQTAALVAAAGAIPPLVHLLGHGSTAGAKGNAAAALSRLAVSLLLTPRPP